MAFMNPPAASLAVSYVSAVATVSGSRIVIDFPAVWAMKSMKEGLWTRSSSPRVACLASIPVNFQAMSGLSNIS